MIIGKILQGQKNETDREKMRNIRPGKMPAVQAVPDRVSDPVHGPLHAAGLRCPQAENTEAPGSGVHSVG